MIFLLTFTEWFRATPKQSIFATGKHQLHFYVGQMLRGSTYKLIPPITNVTTNTLPRKTPVLGTFNHLVHTFLMLPGTLSSVVHRRSHQIVGWKGWSMNSICVGV